MMKKPETKIEENEDWELIERLMDIEREWSASLPRVIDRELLQIYPEAKDILPEKLSEWQEKRGEIAKSIKRKLAHIKKQFVNEQLQVLYREWLKVTEGEELMAADENIARVRRLIMMFQGRTPKGHYTEEQVAQARAYPIERLIDRPMRKTGRTLVGLCPLHNEKHPSFYIYPETNSCWCYGCNRGGDAIRFVQLLRDCDFKKAVQYLIES